MAKQAHALAQGWQTVAHSIRAVADLLDQGCRQLLGKCQPRHRIVSLNE
jgi:hypothetical protein